MGSVSGLVLVLVLVSGLASVLVMGSVSARESRTMPTSAMLPPKTSAGSWFRPFRKTYWAANFAARASDAPAFRSRALTGEAGGWQVPTADLDAHPTSATGRKPPKPPSPPRPRTEAHRATGRDGQASIDLPADG